ncbi:MAG: hypothetical protein GY938_16520 [Ketobacter sp.]|nr:hypothetical protein [Ketobacter sp.]
MNSLLSIARDETESKLNRQRALKKINKEYKGLLPNMDLENVNLAENKRLTDDLTRSLIRKAKIQGAQSLIAKETGKILELQNQELIDNANFWDLAAATAVSVVTATDIRDRAIEAGAKRTTKEVSKAEARIASFTKTLNELLKVDIGENGAFTKVADKITKAISSGEVPSVYIDLGKIFKVDSSKLTGVFVDPVKEELKRLGLLLDQQPAFIAPKLTNIQTKFQEFGDRMASQTLDLASAVSGGFSELGRSLASGAGLLDSAGKAILSFMGSILTQLGQASIAAGVAAIALENLFSNPYTAIAAGAVLVALGAALSSAHSSVSGIGGSSGAVAGQGSGSTSSGGSSSTFVGGSSGYGEVVFRIGGQELIGVLSRVSNKNQRFGLNG